MGRTFALAFAFAVTSTVTVTSTFKLMNTYLALITFTAQGLQNLHESPHRANSFKAAAKKAGAKVHQILWTLGDVDGVILFEAKDDAAATGLMLSLSGLGNVHTKTLRAFNAAEFSKIVAKVPKM